MPSLSEIWMISGLVPRPCAGLGPLVSSGLPFHKFAVDELMVPRLVRGLECLSCLPLYIRRKTDLSVSQHCLTSGATPELSLFMLLQYEYSFLLFERH